MKRIALNHLLAWKNTLKRKPLVIQGARQVGKTYLLKQFATDHFTESYYLNFEENPRLKKIFAEELSPEIIIQGIGLELKKEIKNKPENLIIFDEIQACPEALTSLKYFCEKNLPIGICAAGSLLGIQLNKGSFPVGKVETISLYPLTFREFLEGTDEQMLADLINPKNDSLEISLLAHQKLWDKLKLYFITGGLPEVVNVYNRTKENQFLAFNAVRKQQKEII